ncbi:exonuclease II Exo2, partial [Coemansia sp. RSA 1804]
MGYEYYKPSFVVARELGISSLLLSRITSKMAVVGASKSGDAVRIQIGLALKFEARRLKVLGYTRRGPNGWQFSAKAIALISQYRDAFPDLFARLENFKSNDDLLTTDKCFGPNDPNTLTVAEKSAHIDAEVKRIKQWLKTNVNYDGMVQLPIESELLSNEQVDAIAAVQAKRKTESLKKIVVRDVHREAVLLPANAPYLLQSQSLMVGHRVVYIADRSGT